MKGYPGLACALALALICACSSETALEGILGASVQAPVFLGCKAVSPSLIEFRFNTPVRVEALRFDPPLAVVSVEEGPVLRVTLAGPAGPGERLTADILVEDERGNTLNVLVPFRARNDRVPPLIITEIRTEYAKPKVEFVEIKTQGPGNLAALRLFAASTSVDQPLFELPPVEVRAGEYVVIHLRTLDEGCLDETGADLNASSGAEAIAGVRDLWVPLQTESLRKSDAVYIVDQDGRVLDALMVSDTAGSAWSKEGLRRGAELLAGEGAWLPLSGSGVPGPDDAVNTAGTGRTICRDEAAEDTNRAADWYIANGATPGKPNDTRRYR